MTFETSKKIDEWMKKHNKKCKTNATAGEHYEWVFLPTTIVECQTIRCLCCGKEFTDYID